MPAGGAALFIGVGAPSAKSAALLSVSSVTSSWVAQPPAMERLSDMPAAIAGAGLPVGDGREAAFVTEPQATQSTTSQQAAPAAGLRWSPAASAQSAATPKAETALGVAISAERWASPLGSVRGERAAAGRRRGGPVDRQLVVGEEVLPGGGHPELDELRARVGGAARARPR